jgi:WD40 repeat protein
MESHAVKSSAGATEVASSIFYICLVLVTCACGAVAGQPTPIPPSHLLVSPSPATLPTALPATAAPTSTHAPTAVATRTAVASPYPFPSPTAIPTASILSASLVLTGHTDWVTQLAWSPDGSLLASNAGRFDRFDTADLNIRLWRPDGTLAHVLAGHTQRVTALAWSPDGQTLASSSIDETMRLWKPDGTLTKTLQGHAGQVFAVAWSPDGKILASGSLPSGSIVSFSKPTVQWWNGAGQIVKTLSTASSGGKFYNLAWSPDGGYLVGGATDYKEWDANGQQVGAWCDLCTPAWAMAWSPDSQRWAIGNESGEVHIYSNTGAAIASVADSNGAQQLAWSPDSKILADTKTLWRADGSKLADLIGQPRYVNAAAWSPDGKILATGGRDGTVYLWTSTGGSLGLLMGHTGPIEALAWAPAGRLLASASDDKTIRLWVLK